MNTMKKTLLSLLATIATATAGETRTVSLSWDHDGVDALGFKVYVRSATNATYVPVMTVPSTNRSVTLTFTNPPAFQQFVMTTTNQWFESDMSPAVTLAKPGLPSALRVVTVVTVQTP